MNFVSRRRPVVPGYDSGNYWDLHARDFWDDHVTLAVGHSHNQCRAVARARRKTGREDKIMKKEDLKPESNPEDLTKTTEPESIELDEQDKDRVSGGNRVNN